MLHSIHHNYEILNIRSTLTAHKTDWKIEKPGLFAGWPTRFAVTNEIFCIITNSDVVFIWLISIVDHNASRKHMTAWTPLTSSYMQMMPASK